MLPITPSANNNPNQLPAPLFQHNGTVHYSSANVLAPAQQLQTGFGISGVHPNSISPASQPEGLGFSATSSSSAASITHISSQDDSSASSTTSVSAAAVASTRFNVSSSSAYVPLPGAPVPAYTASTAGTLPTNL